MKVLKKKYPKGSFPYQQTDGRYIDKFLYQNLKFLSEKIVKDMTFLGVCFSSTLEVGTGKSVLMTQIGEIWTAMVNKMHGTKLKFNKDNIVFRPKDLIERSFQLPKYSCILLDEWEDAHYWSELGKTLREYFRKCRQQNLFILIIIPNYFQLNISYAINRSIFAIDVKFDEELERGNYDFYDFNAKKKLYIKGKKFYDYHVAKRTFDGHFGDGYGVDRKEYLKAKKEDLERWDRDDKEKVRPEKIAHDSKLKTVGAFIMNEDLIKKKGLTTDTISKIFNINLRTAQTYVKTGKEKFCNDAVAFTYTIKQIQQNVVGKKILPPIKA